jgi:type IV secretory pathway VirB2 component (pilin)
VAAAEQAAPVAPDNTARTLAVVGIIVGAVGLLVAALALRNRPRVKR